MLPICSRRITRIVTLTALTLVSHSSVFAADAWTLDRMVTQDRDGRRVFHGRPVEERYRNPISDEDERGFQERARHVIGLQADMKVAAGNTYFENEKRTYGYLMAQALAGRPDAIKNLQLEDAQAQEWHRETQGIDLFACFTLKHQVRKFFYFGDLLEPAYRQRMYDGAKAWSAQDPLRRPHYAFKKAGEGWGPDTKNSWVDVRSTENLYLMRVTSVYLFAEATGNRAVADQYKQELRRYAKTLYRVGMGEWDSENYHGHSIGPLCNLYDFARDDEVRLLAKASLDWIFAAGAVKYYRGAFNGPTKRDYNHAQPFGGSAANMLWLHFGDTPRMKSGEWESDEVHLITSAYRPPPAVLALARKQFEFPVEILSAKPHYSASTSGDEKSPPEYLETNYWGRTFAMGSLASGTSEDGGDVNGFKLLAFSERDGARALQCIPGPDPAHVGSPQYQKGKVSGPNRVAQHGNLAIWLVKNGKSPWTMVVPQAVKVTQDKDVTLLEFDRTWVAVRGLGTSRLTRDEALTRQVSDGEKARFPEHQVLTASGTADRFCGLAFEVGEASSHRSRDEFLKQASAAQVDLEKLNEGVVQYKSTDGKWLGFHWNDNANDLGCWRNGQRHDWNGHAQHLYHSNGRDDTAHVIESRRGSGKLRVAAGGKSFECEVSDSGQVSFSNSP